MIFDMAVRRFCTASMSLSRLFSYQVKQDKDKYVTSILLREKSKVAMVSYNKLMVAHFPLARETL